MRKTRTLETIENKMANQQEYDLERLRAELQQEKQMKYVQIKIN
jgi:hypothetical protein